MSTALFVMGTIPITLAGPGPTQISARTPKYASDLGRYAGMYFGAEPVVLVAADPNPIVSANPDVLTFPADLDQQMSDADVSSMTAFLENLNVPANGILATSVTYRQALRVIAGAFQFAQKLAAQSETQIFIGDTTLDTSFSDLDSTVQSALVATAQNSGLQVDTLASVASASLLQNASGVISPASNQAAPSPNPDPLTLPIQIEPVEIDPSNLTADSSIRDVLISVGQSFGDSHFSLNRGDGFAL